jgi:hypothetical protein
MGKSIVLASLFSLVSLTAIAQPKPGQFTGVKQCKGSAKGIAVDVTSKKTIGVATCKTQIQKELAAKGACDGVARNKTVEYTWTFGKDSDADQAKGTAKLICK